MRKKLLRAIEKAYKLWVYKTHRASDHALINLGGDKADIYGVYTVMNVIPENACIISAGLGTDTNFEEAVLKNYRNATVFAFDPTPKSINYVKEIKHLDQEKRFHFSHTVFLKKMVEKYFIFRQITIRYRVRP